MWTQATEILENLKLHTGCGTHGLKEKKRTCHRDNISSLALDRLVEVLDDPDGEKVTGDIVLTVLPQWLWLQKAARKQMHKWMTDMMCKTYQYSHHSRCWDVIKVHIYVFYLKQQQQKTSMSQSLALNSVWLQQAEKDSNTSTCSITRNHLSLIFLYTSNYNVSLRLCAFHLKKHYCLCLLYVFVFYNIVYWFLGQNIQELCYNLLRPHYSHNMRWGCIIAVNKHSNPW